MFLNIIKIIVIIPLIILSILIIFSIFNFTSRDENLARMKANFSRYEATGDFATTYLSEHHRYPTTEEVRNWAKSQGWPPLPGDRWNPKYGDHWINSIEGNPTGGNSAAFYLEDNFKLPETDRYILSSWRGEWFDCYSLPSRTSNISRSLRDDAWKGDLLFIGIAIALILVSWLIRPRRRPRLHLETKDQSG